MPAAFFHAGGGENQRGIHVILRIAVFCPGIVFPQFPSVIPPENHDGVAPQPQAVQFRKNAAHLRVHIADAGIIGMLELPREVIRHMTGWDIMIQAQLIAGQNRILGGGLRAEGIRGELDFRGVVKVPIFLGRHEGEMRLDQAHREKEGRFFSGDILQGGDRQIRDLAIGIGIMRDLGALKRRAARVQTVGGNLPGGVGLFFAGNRFAAFAVAIRFARRPVGIQLHIFRQGINRRLGIHPGNGPRLRIIKTTVIELAHALDKIAVVLEQLRQGDHVRQRCAKMGLQIPHPGRVRPRPGQQAGAGRRAHRLLAIGTIEDHALRRDAVDIRAADIISAITTEFRTQIIHCNEQNVRLGRRNVRGTRGQKRHPKEQGDHSVKG